MFGKRTINLDQEGDAMKVSTKQIKLLVLLAVGSLLLLPAFVAADQYVELGTVKFGPGTNTETFLLGAQNRLMSTSSDTLKSLIISVQNGDKKGKTRASSAVINVNGEDIFTQKDFNQNVLPSSLTTTRDVDDPDMQEVVLKVRVNGHKDVRMGVTITAVYEEQEIPMQWCLDTNFDGMPDGIVGMGTTTTPPTDVSGGVWFPCQ